MEVNVKEQKTKLQTELTQLNTQLNALDRQRQAMAIEILKKQGVLEFLEGQKE